MYPYITIFNKTITSYALCILIGILFVGFLCLKDCRKNNLDDNKTLATLLVALTGAFIFSHILYTIVNYELVFHFIANIEKVNSWSLLIKCLQQIFGGSVFYGGLLGGIFTAFVYVRIQKIDIQKFIYIITPYIPLFHFFGRIGCFLYGCCYGFESSFGVEINGITRFPIQLVEAIYNLLLFFLLLYLRKKIKFKSNLLVVYLFLYAVGRFIIEYFRGDTYRGIFFGLSTSQWLSLIVVIFCFVYFLKYLIRQRTK